MSEIERARERALAFIESTGEALDRCLARALCGKASTREVVGAWEALLAEAPLDCAAALGALGALEDVRALRSPCAKHVCQWLEGAQAPDGSFGGDGTLSEAEADEFGRLARTGMLAGHLAKTPYARPETLAAAGDWLEAAFTPERLQEDWRVLAGYGHCFANVLHEGADAILQWCGRELEKGFRSGRIDAVRTARVFVWCDAGSLPGGGALSLGEVVPAVVAEQQPDGGWLRFEAPSSEQRVAHTLTALAVLARA